MKHTVEHGFPESKRGEELLNIVLRNANEQSLSEISIYQTNKRDIKGFVKPKLGNLTEKVIYVESAYQRGIIEQTDWEDILSATEKIEKFLKYIGRSSK